MKTAIIIGATSGIGREVAIRLIKEGWRVGIAGRREERLKELQTAFGSEKVSYAVLDVIRKDATSALDMLLADTGAPDLFLHASGIGNQNPGMDEEKEMRVIQTNCDGMVRMVSHFINYVKQSLAYNRKHKAHVAVVTSVAGTAGLGISAAYSASKKMQMTYLSALSQLARMEKIPVQFTDIRPGFVATEILDMSKNYPLIMSVEKAADYILRGIKLKRRVVIFDWRFRLLTAAWRLIPRGIWERLTFVKTN